MPVMDGYESTRHILRLAEEHNKHNTEKQVNVDVVAITAFVNEENVKECYNVGMQ